MAEKAEPREYAAILVELPQAHAEATAELAKVIAAVRDTGKAGALNVQFKVTVGKIDESTIEIVPLVKSVIPRQALKGGVFYEDADGNPTKEDPSQLWRGEDIRSAPTFRDDNVTANARTGEVHDIKEAPKA